MTITRKKNIAKTGPITRALKPPNMTLPLWKPSPTEAFNDELYKKPVVMLPYNTIKGFKMKQGRRYEGYSEIESKYCTLQKRVQQANNKCLEQLQHQKIVLPPFVDTNDQYTASMLTGDS